MFRNKPFARLLVASFASIVATASLVASVRTGDAVPVAAAPCEPVLDAPRIAPPTGLRIIRDDTDFSGPYVADPDFEFETVDDGLETAAANTYFDTLSARPDCMVAYHLRSEAQVDAIETVKSGTSEKGEVRFPVTYDSVVDAALWRIDPRVGSTDGEGKRLPVGVKDGSLLLTWELRFDTGHTYVQSGYLSRHKMYMLGWQGVTSGDNRWLGFKTEYINAAQAGQGVAEIYAYMIGDTYLGPGTSLGAQSSIQPSTGRFFIAANTWTRVWVFLQDIGLPVSYVSIWVADPSRGPVQLQNRNAVLTPPGGITKFWFEYDTSEETAANPEMRSWNRNFVLLRNVPATEVPRLLLRPTP